MTHYQCSNCDISGKTLDEVKKNGCNCGVAPIPFLDPEDHKEESKKEIENKNDTRKENKKLYDHTLAKIKRLVVSEKKKKTVLKLFN